MSPSGKRIVLKVELYGNSTVKLTLIHLDNRFLSGEKDFKHFHRIVMGNFYLSSNSTLSIYDNFVRFPSLSNYKRGVKFEKDFGDSDKRYNFLKKFYDALNLWNEQFDDFKKSIDYNDRNERVILQGVYWIL